MAETVVRLADHGTLAASQKITMKGTCTSIKNG